MIPGMVVYWMMIKNKVIPVSMVVYWMMILWLKQSDTWKLKQSDTCVNGGLLNDDILIKTKWYLCQWWFKWWYDDNKGIWLKQSDTCVNMVYWMMIH